MLTNILKKIGVIDDDAYSFFELADYICLTIIHFSSKVALRFVGVIAIIGIISGCAGPPAKQLRAETNPIQLVSKKKPLDITECLSIAWEPLLIPNFVFVKPLTKGYLIDKTSDMGHLYLSALITESEGMSKITFWITRYVWLDSSKDKAKRAVTACL